MKLIIDIDEKKYEEIKRIAKAQFELTDKTEAQIIANGIPYKERPHSEFTDLERTVIADSINYLLGAELLEENGYTEEVVNALKSVLQKISAERSNGY